MLVLLPGLEHSLELGNEAAHLKQGHHLACKGSESLTLFGRQLSLMSTDDA